MAEIVSFPVQHGGSFHSFLRTFTRDGPRNPRNPYDKSHIKLPIGISINYMGFLFILGFLLININY